MACAESSCRDAGTPAVGSETTLHASSIGSFAQRLLDLEQRNEELESFIRALAHDSSAITRGIGLRTQLLRERVRGGDPDTVQLIDGIEDRTVRLARLAEALMRLARIGARTLACTELDLSAMAREVIEGLLRDFPARRVHVQIQPGLVAWGDADLIRIALENLIGNAWKYTARAQAARIDIGCRADPKENVFFVADNGVGFAPENAALLFSPFGRLASAHAFEGSGLGLATVKRIVERHGGWIRAQGEADRGTTILFCLDGAAGAARRASCTA